MKPSPCQSRQSRQVLTQKWSKLLVRKMIKKQLKKMKKLGDLILSPQYLILSLDDLTKSNGLLDILKLPELAFERFSTQLSLENRVEIISKIFCT